MSKIPNHLVEKILLEVPNSSKIDRISIAQKNYYSIDDVIVAVPTNGIDITHLIDILENQLDMHWWMIDYILGQNDITL